MCTPHVDVVPLGMEHLGVKVLRKSAGYKSEILESATFV